MKVAEKFTARFGDQGWGKKMLSFWAGVQKTAAQRNPKVFNAWRDRYCSPSGYEPWNQVAAYTCLATSYAETRAAALDPVMFTNGLMTLVAQKLDPPAIYLKRDLVDSFLRTSIGPMAIPNTVFPGFFLMVPNGVLTTDEGEGVSSLFVCEDSEYLKFLRPHVSEKWLQDYYDQPNVGTGEGGLRVTATSTNGVVYGAYTNWEIGTDWRNYPNNPEQEPELLDFTSQLSQLAKNAVLLMNHRYELLTTQQINPPRSQRGFGAAARQTKPIYWLGKDFVAKKVQATSNGSGEANETTISPHWRRGHWHTVLHGPKKSLRKTAWFEPVYVTGQHGPQ